MGPVSDWEAHGHGLGQHGKHLSIVVPTYNCARWLGDTLRSLQAQGTRLNDAEVVVMDDHSTADDPEAVVRDVWGDRVVFVRHPKNIGPTRNFNACLARASREWIHILHGDDYVFAGAYDEFDACIRAVPEATAVFARTVYVDAEGVWLRLSDRLGPEPRGRLAYVPTMWSGCLVQFAGVLVSKRAVAAVGGFDEQFSHAADYNLWCRLARQTRVAYTNACVGAYRHFAGNHTSTLRRTARNLLEHVQQVQHVEESMRTDGTWSIDARRALYAPITMRALRQSREYLADPDAFDAHDRVLAMLPLSTRSQVRRAELRLRCWAYAAR
jgi:cellulose synthase/poly-beta-1,6-N-acetylglucosamine synthase-like glycosyltransferase